MKAIGWITVGLLVTVLSTVWSGYVFSVLWFWFVVRAFHLPVISIAMAIGLGIVVRLLTYSSDTNKDKDKSAEEGFLSAALYSFFLPLLFLVMGAIVHMFV